LLERCLAELRLLQRLLLMFQYASIRSNRRLLLHLLLLRRRLLMLLLLWLWRFLALLVLCSFALTWPPLERALGVKHLPQSWQWAAVCSTTPSL